VIPRREGLRRSTLGRRAKWGLEAQGPSPVQGLKSIARLKVAC
jgi:hypothetical protein